MTVSRIANAGKQSINCNCKQNCLIVIKLWKLNHLLCAKKSKLSVSLLDMLNDVSIKSLSLSLWHEPRCEAGYQNISLYIILSTVTLAGLDDGLHML